jgi:hypothetical protein
MPRNNRRGGAIAGIILTILILGFVGFAALVSTGLYVAHNIRVSDSSRDEASIETPFGSVHVRDHARFDPRHLGVPVYPGAVREHDARKLANFHFDFGDVHKGFAISAAEYRTSDSVERVTNFYRNELPHWLVSQNDNGCLRLSFTKGGYKRMVAVFEEDGETRIALASMGEPASN